MNEEIRCINNRGKRKMATTEWENDYSDTFHQDNSFFYTYSLPCFNKGTTALLKAINI